MAELQAMEFVRRHTSIPVPRVIAAHEDKDGSRYLLMTRCRGKPLSEVFGHLSSLEQKRVLEQLGLYVRELRTLQPQRPGAVGSVTYGEMNDPRVLYEAYGPFENVIEFHAALRSNLTAPSGIEDLDSVIAWHGARTFGVNFTHGDLALHNIIYHRGKISGIIDWEFSGWLPDYWEYVHVYDGAWNAPTIRACLDEFLEPYHIELNMERVRRKLFTGFTY